MKTPSIGYHLNPRNLRFIGVAAGTKIPRWGDADLACRRGDVFHEQELEVEMEKILVMDDDRGIRMLYEDELSDEGYKVITHDNVDMLMGTIEKEKPDLIVMDLKLTGCDGLKLLEEVRSTYEDLPVILCTAYPAFALDPRSKAADFIVEKRSDLRELKSKIKLILENGHWGDLTDEIEG